jgi:signal transduction histidine kinase
MGFRISARTVLELGSELISSDEVALYELVKNAIDAHSKDGVDLRFHISLSHSVFSDVMQELESGSPRSIDEINETLLNRVEPTVETDDLTKFKERITDCKTIAALRKALPDIYAESSWLEIRDTGTGMSAEDLLTKYLVIGTPARKKEIDNAEKLFKSHGPNAPIRNSPFLGEKGVGRLSAMRLGWLLQVKSATEQNRHFNVVNIDWRRFQDLDLFVEDIEIVPTRDGPKPDEKWSGTNIKISGLSGNWSQRRIREVATAEFSKISDPFSVGKKRFRIAVYFNGERVEIPRMDQEILSAAQAMVRASYIIKNGIPSLDVYMTFKGPERNEDKHLHFSKIDLSFLTDDPSEGIPAHAARTVGPFEFEAYWYNRQKLRAIDSIGNLNVVRELQRRWSGIMLFRDGYRVLPYGEDKDDWLGLDRKALASPGYKLNKTQFIGRAQITRLANPQLIDQTNREGLKETPEKYVFVETLRYVIQNLLRNFMDEIERSQHHVDFDIVQVDANISSLESRAIDAVRRLKRRHRDSSVELQDLLDMFEQMKSYFEQARALAEQAEDERARLIQLAGIGLMLEVVAHELARSTETAMQSLANAQTDKVPSSIASTLKILRTEMQTMNKRLRVLDPLSVSGRQHRETFDLASLVRDIFDGRSRQFERHRLRAEVEVKGGNSLKVTGVRGMYVQIIENLTSNSVFWLKKRFAEETGFVPKIKVLLDVRTRRLSYSDNGPGVSKALKDDIFRPFFSTKDRRRRQGLGLYIARECAQYNDARLYLSDQHTEHDTRLNTFILELPDSQ